MFDATYTESKEHEHDSIMMAKAKRHSKWINDIIMSKLILNCSNKLHYVSKLIHYCLTVTLEQAS